MKILLLSLLFIIACAADKKPNAMATARKAMQYFKAGDADGIRSILNQESLAYKSKRKTNFYVASASEYLTKYGISPENTWISRVDTVNPILVLEIITIPIFNGYDSTNGLEEAHLELQFDYTGQYVPKSKMSGFQYIAHLR